MYRSYSKTRHNFCIMYNVKSIRILVEIFIEKVKRLFAKIYICVDCGYYEYI